ncbi:hypothetical protein K5Y94_004593 [Escherichia coli]|nr:hypothetical protein [Escherichia coli]EIP7907968.1 hypothetical protein [Escherichia coli]
MAPDITTGRDPPQRREARFAKRRCSLHPGGLLPGCRERRPRRDWGGATGTVAAGLVFQTSDRSGSPKPRQRVRRRLAGARAAACRSRADDRMPPGSREPKGSTPPGVRTTETT